MEPLPAKSAKDGPMTYQRALDLLAEYGWMAKSRHQRDRMLYRALEFVLDRDSQARVDLAEARRQIALLKGEAVPEETSNWRERARK